MKGPETMNLNDNQTDTPAGEMRGADHVFLLFQLRLGDTPLRKLMRAAIIMNIIFLAGSLFIPFTSVVPLPVLIAFSFVPANILRGGFVDEVIPECRRTCSDEDIVRGAMQCLRFMWGRYILYLLPGLLIFFGVLFAFSYSVFHAEFFGLILLYIPQILVLLLGEYALGHYSIARVFSRRGGTTVMMLVILLGQIVLTLDFLGVATGLSTIAMSSSYIIHVVIQSIVILVVCAVFSVDGIRYFTKAALADAEKNGMPQQEKDM